MKKILSYVLSIPYIILFVTALLIFHPIQAICRKTGGYQPRKKAVDILNYILVYGLTILGCRIRFKGFENLPQNRPFIIVSNHQNTMDIPPIVIGFRKHHPKFVSKIELGKGIPSISYNLRHGGSALIDRKNPRQSISEIMKLGKHIEKENYCASIFPEGTRSKNGKVKTFQHAGIASLLKYAPSALIVPYVIDGNNKLLEKGYYPLTFGTKLTYTALPAIDPAGRDPKELTQEIEMLIKKELGQV
ncbi:lysophospholipid acyltransferase family protein [Prolixibacteraceae bacterium Z1-6]|uniref:Lysophospholipid acyltransferase family protein n=1 Tax=Draconibacterium aestuarii TaxID=2998507 RepID=A0A9X3J3Z1_9BACT|nr:lysophospholipid acyltransferase family protein [Prolixibacteraceae bacterium Z1-6]